MERNFEKSNIEWKTEYGYAERGEEYEKTEKLLSKDIANSLTDMLKKKITDFFHGSLPNPEHSFYLKDTISMIESSNINIGGTNTFDISFEIKGKEKDLFEQYKRTLEEKILTLKLDPEKLYAVYYWLQDFSNFSKEVTDYENTPTDGAYLSNIIDRSKN